jgi:hypothetical protein
MPTTNAEGAREFSDEEQILHHYAAMIKKDIEAYHACSRTQENWRQLFIGRLASIIFVIHFYK